MPYDKYFQRVQDSEYFDKRLYSQAIRSSSKNQKALNLFKDCFSNHTDFAAPYTNELIFEDHSTKRYIQKDNLSAYFINKVYQPPNIFDYDSGEEIEYEDFVDEFAEPSFYQGQDSRFVLGSNRIRYVVGDVGQGKSAFMKSIYCSLVRKMSEADGEYKVVSVYIDLERRFHYADKPIPLKELFETYLFEKLIEQTCAQYEDFDLTEIFKINSSNDRLLAIKLLISMAKDQGVRFLVYIDNLDFYHYYYARYSYFENGYAQQEESIIENIMWLRSILISPECLGHLGLNILIAARSHVYEEIVSCVQGVETEVDTTQAVFLEHTPEEVVIGSRLELFSQAIEVVYFNRPGSEKSLLEFFTQIKIHLLGEKITEGDNPTPFKVIYKLGQHGHRSLVQFLASLNLDHFDEDLFERFFERKISSLYILYFNKMFKRYTQEKDHFPNMFLVDCTVMNGSKFPEAHQPHLHTYWLKYFVLKYIYSKKNGVKLSDILEIFRDKGGYDDHLVRHVVGSLCTSNEFRCAQVDQEHLDRPFEGRRIRATERGRMLFRDVEGIELCFEFEYLGTVIDDRWLSYPKPFFSQLSHPNSNYGHLFMTGREYSQGSLSSLHKKSREVLYFLRTLDAAYQIEIKERKSGLHSILADEGLIPDFSRIRNRSLNSIRKLLNTFSSPNLDEEFRSLITLDRELQDEREYEAFFHNYFESGELVES